MQLITTLWSGFEKWFYSGLPIWSGMLQASDCFRPTSVWSNPLPCDLDIWFDQWFRALALVKSAASKREPSKPCTTLWSRRLIWSVISSFVWSSDSVGFPIGSKRESEMTECSVCQASPATPCTGCHAANYCGKLFTTVITHHCQSLPCCKQLW